MASINLQGDTSGSISISAPSVAGSNTLTLPATTQTLATQNSLGVRNRIINGAMVIDQRNAGASVSFSSSYAYYLDRFGGRLTTSTGSTIAQSSTAPTGFNKSLLVTIGTGASATSTQLNTIYQAIEGYNVADLGFGTANAKTFTLSFWVRSSLTGTFGGAFQNDSNNRSYPFTYTISAANTWEQKTITVAGDTTGTWNTTNTSGLTIWFDLGSGSNFQGTAGAWAGSDYRAATGATSLVATSGATFYITGVQLEVGTATPFEHRPYDMELQRCQRYCQVYLNPPLRGGIAVSSNTIATKMAMVLPVVMRTAPDTAIIQTGSTSHFRIYDSGATQLYSSVSATFITPSSVEYDFTMAGGLTGGRPAMLYYDTALTQSQFTLSAEL